MFLLKGDDSLARAGVGTLTVDGRSVPIEDPKLVGETVSFVAALDPASAARYEFTGRIVNHAIHGTMRITRAGATSQTQAWSASRTEVWEPRHFALPAPTLVPPQPQ